MEAERFLLKWNNHQSNLVNVFDQLYEQEAFTDVTLACDGRTFAAHKVILSACSPYFQGLFLKNPCNHPIIFMKDVRSSDMEALLAFMYRGEINVHQQDLASFLKTAESLQIKGLSDSSERHRDTSKILEAMERKFCSPFTSHTTPTSSTPQQAPTPTPPSSNVTSSDSPTPPSKRFKVSEELPRILPKMKPLTTAAPPGLVAPTGVPGLLTPITLAATVMKNAAQAAAVQAVHPRPPTPETTNSSSPNSDSVSPSKEHKRKEGYISGDTPHPVYLVSSVGGIAAAAATGAVAAGGATTPSILSPALLNASTLTASSVSAPPSAMSSGNSTPSHEVKVEEEDPIDDVNSFSDDPGNEDASQEPVMASCFPAADDVLGAARDKLTYPCRYCGKRFTQTGTCRRHERLHTAPNSFKCPFCQKGFNRKYRLKEHVVSYHPRTSDEQDLSILINNAASTV
ncbi:uncharacterized protein LOC143026294 isoform X2 [Oratosquilla oratoria]|uniref:uncharacterized protein LOC143026294 isoform X2 n=1 Tax=Oratosquilla oratoria TaxID=337810 RepID=UPI003F75A1BE